MDLSLQTLRYAAAPWHRSSSFASSSQICLLACRPRPSVVRCCSAREGIPTDSASWMQADAASDPYLGWASDGSSSYSTTGKSTAGWIKIGGGFALAVAIAFGTWTIYTKKDMGAGFSATPTAMEQIISVDNVAKLPVTENNMNDPVDSNQDEYISQENKTGGDNTTPIEQHKENNPSGKVTVPAPADKLQERVLAALQTLQVIETGMDPGSICTKREYARWLIKAGSLLLRNPSCRVFPATYIEGASTIAFDDVLPEDPDFPYIQGLAEAGLMASQLDRGVVSVFLPDSPLTRQDLVAWKAALGVKPAFGFGISGSSGKKMLQEASGFIDIDTIHEDAWPALLADVNAGEQGIIALAFGFTRRFQPDRPVTKGQAAIAVAAGQTWELITEELSRLEAESVAEAAIVAKLALEKKAQQEVDLAFSKLLQEERDKQQVAASQVEAMQLELDQVKLERDEEKYALLKERTALDSEKQLLSGIRQEVEQQSVALSNAKLQVAFEKEQLDKLHADVEEENLKISKIRSELEIEKTALTLARAWAEDEARKAHEHSEVLKQARKRWEAQGIKVHVDKDLDDTNIPSLSWHYSQDFSTQTPSPATNTLLEKSRDTFVNVVTRLFNCLWLFFEAIKQAMFDFRKQFEGKCQEVRIKSEESKREIAQGIKQMTTSSLVWAEEGPLKVVGDWKEGAKRFAQKLKHF